MPITQNPLAAIPSAQMHWLQYQLDLLPPNLHDGKLTLAMIMRHSHCTFLRKTVCYALSLLPSVHLSPYYTTDFSSVHSTATFTTRGALDPSDLI